MWNIINVASIPNIGNVGITDSFMPLLGKGYSAERGVIRMSDEEHELGLAEEDDELDILDSSLPEDDEFDEEKEDEYAEFYEDLDDD
ncbi:MAG: hypothetical protein AAB221_10825 [Bacteroidota bacterium]